MWTYNYDADETWWIDSDIEFGTKEEAIAAAKRDVQQTLSDRGFTEDEITEWILNCPFYVGELIPWIPRVDGNSIIEHLQENAFDECGDAAENWLVYPSLSDKEKRKSYDDMVEKLSDRLTKVFLEWCEEMHDSPNFYVLLNVEKRLFTD